MIKWNTQYVEHAVKAILYLLRDRFMYATDYDQMRKVFLDEPCLLHTADVQAAFVHLALKNEDPKFVPAMNQRFYPAKPVLLEHNTTNRKIPNKKAYLETIGIKDISLTLAIPSNLSIVCILLLTTSLLHIYLFIFICQCSLRMEDPDKNLI